MQEPEKNALRKLIEAVESQEKGGAKWCDLALGPSNGGRALDAYRGSLDAAKALHEALLPGHPAIIELEGIAQVSWFKGSWKELSDAEVEGNPSRAWLIAILKAYEAHQ